MRTPSACLFLAAVIALPLSAQQPDSALIRRALRLHRAVPMIDGHNDLAASVLYGYSASWDSADIARPVRGLDTNIPRLRAAGVGAQFWSVWVPPQAVVRQSALHLAVEQIDLIRQMEARYPDTFERAGTAADIERIHRRGRIASLIGVEGGHAIENSLGALRQLYALGARYMTLTWNNGLAWVDAGEDTARVHGLSPFGREIVREMNRLGMLVDLSHTSDSTAIQAIRLSESPVIFSHSDARALVDIRRNVPDGILRMVRDNGGVVMVNFLCAFLDSATARHADERSARIRELRASFGSDSSGFAAAARAWLAANPAPLQPGVGVLADHIDHIRDVAGIDHAGYGSDYDGISCAPRGMGDVSGFPLLTAELLRRGYSDADVKKVIGFNLLRALRQAEQVSARLQRGRGPSTATLAGLDSTRARR
jgi:membrane dipeptidase